MNLFFPNFFAYIFAIIAVGLFFLRKTFLLLPYVAVIVYGIYIWSIHDAVSLQQARIAEVWVSSPALWIWIYLVTIFCFLVLFGAIVLDCGILLVQRLKKKI